MKCTPSLLALFTAIIAAAPYATAAEPLASATFLCSGDDGRGIEDLAISNAIKRLSVTGGQRIVQTITVKNNGANKASGLALYTRYNPENTLVKGTGRAPGTKSATLNTEHVAILGTLATTGSNKLSIPSGKMLKATISYKAKACPDPNPTKYNFGPAAVSLSDTCFRLADSIEVRP
jgi:hypothetical protein